MAKFTTPYDTLLRVRRIEEDKAKAALAAANHAHRSAQAGLASRRAHFDEAATVPVGEMDVSAFARRVAHTRLAAEGVGWGQAAVEKAHEARVVAVEDTRQASMRTQGLEKLVERAKEARMTEMLAADQRTAEESMAGKRGRRSSKPAAASPSDAPSDLPADTGPSAATVPDRHRGDR